LSCSVLTFRYDESTKQFTRLDSLSTLPVGFAAQNTCADIHFHPNGKFLYGSNRGHDSIVIYAIDPASGKLTLVGHQAAGGAVPRNFMLTPDGRWMLVAHQNSSTVSAFRVDAVTGRLTPAGAPSRVATPVCLKM
jgi:6-phosphogluconolactonase